MPDHHTDPIAGAYRDALLALIQAPTLADKRAQLAALRPPPAQARWTLPTLPPRPGRAHHLREVAEPPRRRRGLAHAATRLRFLHAIYHIEVSAIDLAALACLRGSGMPTAFHRDFLGIARDEATHSGWLDGLLRTRGYPPGSDSVHHKLWESALAVEDLGGHLVVVPRFLEARGLDVSAELLPRLAAIDEEAATVLGRIYREEIGHVGIGTHWHRIWCHAEGLAPERHFMSCVERYFPGGLAGSQPLDSSGRQAAGFADSELDFLRAAGR